MKNLSIVYRGIKIAFLKPNKHKDLEDENVKILFFESTAALLFAVAFWT
jgi:hypothetical protein